MKELNANDTIYLDRWGNKYLFIIGTFNDYCKDMPDVERKALLDAHPNGDKVYAMLEPAIISGDASVRQEIANQRENAISVIDKEIYRIEGDNYELKALKNGFRYSDGIHFDLIK